MMKISSQWNGCPVEVKLKAHTKPVMRWPYPVPQAHKTIFRDKIKRLLNTNILQSLTKSEWGSPSFGIPQKDNAIFIISDFCIVNKLIKPKPYALLCIRNILAKFCFATTLDLHNGFF